MRGRFGAASGWAGFYAIIIERQRDGALVGSVFWPYEVVAVELGNGALQSEVAPRQSISQSISQLTVALEPIELS